jgi:nucleoid-associated protein YgaU
MTDGEMTGSEVAINADLDARDANGAAATSEAIIEEVPAKPRRSRRLAKAEQPEEAPVKTPTKSDGKGKDADKQRVLTKEEEDAGMLIKPLLIQGELHLFQVSVCSHVAGSSLTDAKLVLSSERVRDDLWKMLVAVSQLCHCT